MKSDLHHFQDSLRCLLSRSKKYKRFTFVHPVGSIQYVPHLGPVHMIPGQPIAPRQLTDPGVNFTSLHGLTPVTVHMSFSLPRDNFERRVTRCTTPGNPPCRGNFSPCEQNAKVATGQE